MGWFRVFVGFFALLLLHASSDLLPLPAEVALAPAPAAAPPKSRSRERSDPSGDLLAARQLAVPVQGVQRSQLRDTFEDRRGSSRTHQAMDIMAPWGTPVLAADEGKVVKISSNRGGGLTLYLVDPSGKLVYYYAHLAGYADGLREGQPVQRGEVIAYVGATGNAPEHAPHLHFAVLTVAGPRRWWGGEAINPYEALRRDDTVTAARR
jgi:murein DD-endopeptidase MepM/ murein hydrolase activator NlpD